MSSAGWEPLPPDVAAWMGIDEHMVPFVLDLNDVGKDAGHRQALLANLLPGGAELPRAS